MTNLAFTIHTDMTVSQHTLDRYDSMQRPPNKYFHLSRDLELPYNLPNWVCC
jgi:hypothetical protein